MEKKISIKDLTKSLKAENNPAGIAITGKVEGDMEPSIEKEDKTATRPPKVKKEKQSRLMEEFEKANAVDNYKLKGVVHIDKDIHEVFAKLKAAAGIKIGRYISYKMEMVIRDNIDEITEIINSSNKNKFLD